MLNYQKIAWTLINNSLEIVIGLGTIVLVTRIHSPEDVGVWTVFTALFFFLTKVREGIVQTALVKFSAGLKSESYWRVLKTSFVISLALETLISLLVATVGLLNVFPKLTALLILYPFYAIGWSVYRWSLFVFQSKLQVEVIFRMNLVVMLMLSIGFSITILGAYPLWAMVLVLGTSSCCAATYGLKNIGFQNIWQGKFSPTLLGELLDFGKYGLVREISGTLSTRINVFLSATLLSFTEAGLLGIAQRFTQLVLIPNAAIQTLIFPKACEFNHQQKNDQLKRLFEESVAMLLGMLLPLVITLSIFASSMIEFFNGSTYVAAAPLLIVMVFTVALYSPFGNGFGSIINAIGKPRLNVTVVTVNSVINITLSVMFMSTIGLYGAVLAPFITETFGFVWIGTILKKELDISFQRCFLLIPNSYQSFYNTLRQKLRSEGERYDSA